MSSDEPSKTVTISICVLGERGAGKTSYIQRVVSNLFDDEYHASDDVTPRHHRMVIFDLEVNVDIKELAISIEDLGEPQYESIARDANGFILVFDLGTSGSIERVPMWLEGVKRVSSGNPMIMIVGNGSDKSHQNTPTKSSLMDMARERECLYWDVSAKSGRFVQESFREYVKRMTQGLWTIKPKVSPTCRDDDRETNNHPGRWVSDDDNFSK